MLKNKAFTLGLMLFSSGCVSLLSKTTDELAWKDYFKTIQKSENQTRNLASSTGTDILQQMLDEVPFRNYLISCDQSECYQAKLVIAFDQAFQRLKEQNIQISASDYEVEQKKFLSAYSYFKMKTWVDTFHQMFLSGLEFKAGQRAVELAEGCESSLEKDDSSVIIQNFSFYSGGSTYLPRAFYACLNDRWQGDVDLLLNETSERLGITIKTDEAKKWIVRHQISPIYRKTLNDLFEKRKLEELEKWNRSFAELSHKIDAKKSVDSNVKQWAPVLRKEFHFFNVEAKLTQAVSKMTR